MMVLGGLRVVDVSEALAGPYCTMFLGDLGADVIKVERVGAGDNSRTWGIRTEEGECGYFLAANRNKRSITLDLKTPRGQDVLQVLLATSDVLVCNVPGLDGLRRIGLDPEVMRQSFPRLIYCAISGHGHSGPYAGRRSYDLTTQAESGTMSLTGDPNGEPMRFPAPLADIVTGLHSTIAILAALLARAQSGLGQFIDSSLLDSQAAWLALTATDYFLTGVPPVRLGNSHPSIVPYQPFCTRDKHIVVAVGTPRHWRDFCEILGLGLDVCDAPRFATNEARIINRTELIGLISGILLTEDAEHWLSRLQEANIPCAPINSVPEILSDPHYVARGNIVEIPYHGRMLRLLASPIRLADTPPTFRLPPPLLGEHTDEILASVGFQPAVIESLHKDGIV